MISPHATGLISSGTRKTMVAGEILINLLNLLNKFSSKYSIVTVSSRNQGQGMV